MITGVGHLSQFSGSDNIPAIQAMEVVYDEITGFSVPATEHSVMCAGMAEMTELETFSRILDIYPTGIVSIVSDTTDYFDLIANGLPKIRTKIMTRDGKTVIRPDSGDPIDIICGTADTVDENSTFEEQGSLRILDEIFGHTLDSQGLKVLDSHVGLIYGDGMNQERIKKMLAQMIKRGYSPLNLVFGIGAYTYQLMTRDELGIAFKATAVEINGEWIPIKKDPATDRTKKSLTGRFVGNGLERVF